MTPTPDLRIGVIGMGARSELASHAHRPGEGSRVTVVADPAERGRALARERFGEDVATARCVEEMLEAPEIREQLDGVTARHAGKNALRSP